ncbi:amine oxidase [Pseudomonas sp. Ost2]|nr:MULTISPECIES: FAD-dependent oxidoreductase [Pseudomonas]BBP76265.1 amine oxidase [Pseudomonas sp. Ost2]
MNRRTLLKQAGVVTMVAASAGVGGAFAGPARKKVIIVGAGVSGLAAASQLAARGYQVTVLEGRERLGGRTWTSAVWPDAPVDLGASWIHGVDGNPLTTLAHQAGIDLVSTSYDSTLDYDVDGKPVGPARQQRLEQLRKAYEQALRKAQRQPQDHSVRASVEDQLDWGGLSEPDKELLGFITNSAAEQEYAGSREELSTHWFDSMGGYPGEDAVPVGGYRKLVDYLARGLDIRLGHIVSSITQDASGVVIVTSKGTLEADKVIITVPLGVLKQRAIEFRPALPEKKLQAIARLGMGHFNKCYLRFPRQFWPAEDWLEFIPSQAQHGQWSQWLNLARLTGQPVLLAFNAGEFGGAIEHWSDQQMVIAAMTRLRQVFGANTPDPIAYQVTRWSQDPFSYGAYSFNRLGTAAHTRDDLAAPIAGRLFFAGEATHREMFATVHGALLSGRRAAQEVEKGFAAQG